MIMNASLLFSTVKVACLGLLLLTASCKKDNDLVTPGSGSSSLPVAGKNLRMVALTMEPALDLDGDGKLDDDLLGLLPDCALDNTIKFETSGTISGSDGANVCPADDDSGVVEVKPGTWTYDTKTQLLRIVYAGNAADAVEWKVLSVSGTTLKASIGMDSVNGDKSMSVVMTWQVQ